MSDLSRLLGDVYGSGPLEDHVDEAVPAQDLPTWADDAALDDAFADWIPGPPSDAPAAERAALADLAADVEPEPELEPEPAAPNAVLPLPETLAEALPVEAEWFFDVPPADDEPAPVVAVDLPSEEAPLVPWQRADDDLLPAKGRRKKR